MKMCRIKVKMPKFDRLWDTHQMSSLFLAKLQQLELFFAKITLFKVAPVHEGVSCKNTNRSMFKMAVVL